MNECCPFSCDLSVEANYNFNNKVSHGNKALEEEIVSFRIAHYLVRLVLVISEAVVLGNCGGGSKSAKEPNNTNKQQNNTGNNNDTDELELSSLLKVAVAPASVTWSDNLSGDQLKPKVTVTLHTEDKKTNRAKVNLEIDCRGAAPIEAPNYKLFTDGKVEFPQVDLASAKGDGFGDVRCIISAWAELSGKKEINNAEFIIKGDKQIGDPYRAYYLKFVSPTDPISDKLDIGWGEGSNVPYRFRVQALSNDRSKSPRRGKMRVSVHTGCKSSTGNNPDNPGGVPSWSQGKNSDGALVVAEIDFDSYYNISQAIDVKHGANINQYCYVRITAPVDERQADGYDDAVSIIKFVHRLGSN